MRSFGAATRLAQEASWITLIIGHIGAEGPSEITCMDKRLKPHEMPK